jgi:hypothetical protein
MRIRTISGLAALALLGAGSLLAWAPQAKADPFCAYYNDGSTECSFRTFQQCLATVRGVGGSCRQNPAYGRRHYHRPRA